MSFFLRNPISSTRSYAVARSFKPGRRRGQALLEAAFILPILLLFMMGIIQFGMIYNARLAMQHACRTGARYAATYGRVKPTTVAPILTADDQIKARIIKAAQSMGLSLAASDIVIGPPLSNTTANPNNRTLYSTLPITINYDMNKRRVIPRSYYFPIGGTTVTLPVFSGFSSVTETVVLEGADVT